MALSALFFMGGSSRTDVQSLAILNPFMIICCGVAITTLKKEIWQERKWLLAWMALIFILVVLYVVPLSEQFQKFSPSGVEFAAIWSAAEIPGATQTLATAPFAAWQSLFFLFAPLAVFLFSIQLNRNDLWYSLPIVILAGSISGVIGVLQLAGGSSGPFYLYRITNYDSAVGIFANRNHAAVFLACLFPMLAMFAARSQVRKWKGSRFQQLTAFAVAVILIPLILVTGSRSGMLVAIVGLIGGVLLYNSHVPSRGEPNAKKASTAILAGSVLLSLVLATIYFSRAKAIERLFAQPAEAIDRREFWTSSLELFRYHFPFGFGPSSFVPSFQTTEPLALLNNSYLNSVHNDWLETVLTFGVPGIVLLVLAIAYYFRRSFLLWVRLDGARNNVAMGRMASVIIAIFAIASMSDYPLRTPALIGLAALVFVWFIEPKRDPDSDKNHQLKI